jgi:hypothetical protein
MHFGSPATKGKMSDSPSKDPPGTASRRAALRLLDAVLRKGLPLEAALDSAARDLDRADDRAFAHAIAAEALRRLADLDELIDHATRKRLPDDAKARFALRIALVQALALDTPHHAAISTVLPLVDGGPRKLVHGVFSTVMREKWALPEIPHLPVAVEERWRKAWGAEVAEAAARSIAAPPPIDLIGAPPPELAGISLMPGHLRLPRGTAVAFGEGRWWAQDISASLPARLLGEGAGRTVLDLCAAPGGKTMQLAAAGWAVTALDVSASRLARLSENLARTGLTAEVIAAEGAGGRDSARRALFGDRHLPPSPRRAPPRSPEGDSRARGRAGGDAGARRRLAEARRQPGLCGLLARTRGGRGGGRGFPRSPRRLHSRRAAAHPPRRLGGCGRGGQLLHRPLRPIPCEIRG